MTHYRRILVFFLDLLLVAVAYSAALLLDANLSLQLYATDIFKHTFIYIIIIKSAVFITSNLYRSIWKYASLHNAIEIFKTVSIASVASGLGLLFFREGEYVSRVVFVLDWGLLMLLVLGSRFVWRLYRDKGVRLFNGNGRFIGKRTLIVGAGDAARMLLQELQKEPSPHYRIVGLIDDDRSKMGMRLMGVEVIGNISQLQVLVTRHHIEKVIIAAPSAGPKFVKSLVDQCRQSGVRFKIIPGLSEIIRGDVKVSHIRDVEIEDLLGREPVVLDKRAIAGYLQGMRVLVSGAAGSIGSEICRQVAHFSPAMLVLLDNAETPLFTVERELTARFPGLRIVVRLGDIKNQERLEQLFDETVPDVVFHAAAYKHVPMLEHNPAEAVLNNVLGTLNMATTAQQYGARNFVLISSDKAVNPTNVMGTTKRIAEKIVQAVGEQSETKFTTVRFGNVLGSNGSVIPIFMEQIHAGGPLTITHPEVTRFFMTIQEASQLVLQAGCFGSGGEIYVLDMGEPVRITDLAEELVRLSGMTPHTDIEFVYTGLRPGEKLYEELFFRGEGILDTTHEKIHVLAPTAQEYEHICIQAEQLLHAARSNDTACMMNLLQEIVPEYVPTPNLS